jgi:hypothetical protein
MPLGVQPPCGQDAVERFADAGSVGRPRM